MFAGLVKTSLYAAMLGVVVLSGCLLGGCKNGSEMSEKDLADIKKGPPKEMPAEALKVMQKANRNQSPDAPK